MPDCAANAVTLLVSVYSVVLTLNAWLADLSILKTNGHESLRRLHIIESFQTLNLFISQNCESSRRTLIRSQSTILFRCRSLFAREPPSFQLFMRSPLHSYLLTSLKIPRRSCRESTMESTQIKMCGSLQKALKKKSAVLSYSHKQATRQHTRTHLNVY